MEPDDEREHRQLCTIELIAEGHARRCPGETCAFWDRGCALARVEAELDGRPALAALLLDLRHALDAGRTIAAEDARELLRRRLATGEEQPAGGPV